MDTTTSSPLHPDASSSLTRMPPRASADAPAAFVDWQDSASHHRPHLGCDFHINARFVADVGLAEAIRYRDTLIAVGAAQHGRPRAQVRLALDTALAGIGRRIPDMELQRFAEEIEGSDWVSAHIDPVVA